jgi:hypothetical protein
MRSFGVERRGVQVDVLSDRELIAIIWGRITRTGGSDHRA